MQVRLGDARIGLVRYLALWGAVAAVFALQRVLHDALLSKVFPPIDYFRWSVIQWYTWAALAPCVFGLAARYPVRAPLRWKALGVHLVASLALTTLAVVAGAAVSSVFEPGFMAQLRQFSLQRAADSMLTYWALVAIQQAVRFHREKTRRELEASRLASELAQSRLHLLRAQLQPHFLFNTLHAIATLLHEDPRAAEDMLLRLSELLRTFLEDHAEQEISLREELALLDLYLGIQRARFGDRLDARVEAAGEALDCAVPTLILQPLVENAIRHGIGARAGGDRIDIDARLHGGELRLEVRNRNSTLANATPANGRPARDGAGGGIGLANTALRLRALHGDAAAVALEAGDPQGVVCRIRLPARRTDAAAAAAARPGAAMTPAAGRERAA